MSENDMLVFMSNGKATSKIINHPDQPCDEKKGPKKSLFRLGLNKKSGVDAIQAKRLTTENALLQQKLEVLAKECIALKEKLRDTGRMEKLPTTTTFHTDINHNITACSQCGCTRTHDSNDIYQLVEQANNNSLDHRVRLVVLELENTKTSADKQQDTQQDTQQDKQQNTQQDKQQNTQQNKQQDTQQDNQTPQQTHIPHNDLFSKLQEELVACKLREAESCLGFKELQSKVKKVEKHWEQFVRDIENSKQACEPNWNKHLSLKESLLSLKVKEAAMTCDFNELKQKLIELETENNVYKRQEKKLREVIGKLEEKVLEGELQKEELSNNLKRSERRTDTLHTQFKEQLMMHKIKEAEQCQALASLRRSKAEMEIENQQLLASLRLGNPLKKQQQAASSSSQRPPAPPDEEMSTRANQAAAKGDDVAELLSKCDMSDIMTESFYADSVFLQSNLHELTNYDCMTTSVSTHTLHEEEEKEDKEGEDEEDDGDDTDSLN